LNWDTTIFSRAALHLKQCDFQGFLVVLRLTVRPDFPGLCGRFPDEKANDMARPPFRRAVAHAIAARGSPQSLHWSW
jgi:hypothetical protein